MGAQKRNLKVTKWLGTIPVVAGCSLCGNEFKVPVTALNRLVAARESLQRQFAAHECKTATVPAQAT